MVLTPRILQAFEFAARAHHGQIRKYPKDTPYICHPLAVAFILGKTGFSEDVIVAGTLHDVVEDTSYTAENIQQIFGETVAQLVLAVSEDKTLEWTERKKAYNEHLKTTNLDAVAISAADLLANNTSMILGLQAGHNVWKDFSYNPLVYIEKRIVHDTERVAIITERLNHPLAQDLTVSHQQLLTLSAPFRH